MLILSDDDVRRALTMEEAITVNEQAFEALASGTAQCPPRQLLRGSHGPSLFKPALLPGGEAGDAEALGLKVVSVRPGNADRGLPTVPATMVTFDAVTGTPTALLSATWLTALRTAAGSAAATKLLARTDSASLVVFGAGLQAEAHVAAMRAARPSISRVTIVNRSPTRAAALAAQVAARHGVIAAMVALDDAAGVAAALVDADVVCCCTNASAPVFPGAALRPGCHVNAVGAYTPDMHELDEACVARCRVVVDEPGATASCGDIASPIASGAVSRMRNDLSTLGELLLRGDGGGDLEVDGVDCTLFKSVGVAVQDVATAAAVVARAKALGLGATVRL